MTSRAHWNILFCLSFAAGCQSLGTTFPWQASREPNYTMDELAALEGDFVKDTGSKSTGVTQAASVKDARDSGIMQASYSANSTPVSAQRVEQLVQAGQAAIRAAGNGNPQGLNDARQNFEHVLLLDGTNSSANHGMAIIADLQKDWPAAEFHYKQSLAANPQDSNLLNDLGYSYLLQDRFFEAEKYLNQALSNTPQHERAHVNLALLSLKRGDRLAAEQRLATIYSASDVTATISRLQRDLQKNQAPVENVATASLPTPASSGQGVPQGQQQQPAYTDAVNQNGMAHNGQQRTIQTAQNDVPISVYPPGMFDDSPGVGSQANQNHGSQNGMVLQQQMPQHQQPMNTQAGMQPYSGNQSQQQYPANQNGMNNIPNGSVAQSQVAQTAQGGYPSQWHQQAPAFDGVPRANDTGVYGQPARVSPGMQSYGQQQNSANGLIQQFQPAPGQYGQQQNPVQNSFAPGRSVQQPGVPNAPLAGLNAGPGSLFPISAPVSQSGGQNLNPQPVYPNQTSYPNQNVQPFANAGYPQQQNPGVSGNVPVQNPLMHGNPVANGANFPHVRQSLPAEQVMQEPSQPNNVQAVSQPQYYYNNQGGQPQMNGGVSVPGQYASGQFVNGQNTNGQILNGQGQQFQQPGSGNSGMNGNSRASGQNQTSTSGPLEAYERQLQSLDSQYNRTLRSMDGSAGGMSIPQAQY